MLTRAPDRTSLLIFSEANKWEGSITPLPSQHQAAVTVWLCPFLHQVNCSLSLGLWVFSRAQLVSCSRWGEVLIKQVGLTMECRCWGVPAHRWGQPGCSPAGNLTWSPCPPCRGCTSCPAQPELQHPENHKPAPRRTPRARTAPGEGTQPPGCSYVHVFFKIIFYFIHGNMHKCLKQSLGLQHLWTELEYWNITSAVP